MSYYCSFEYKGIVKPKYRRDIETAFSDHSWTAVQSEELKLLFENWDDYSLSTYAPSNDLVPVPEDVPVIKTEKSFQDTVFRVCSQFGCVTDVIVGEGIFRRYILDLRNADKLGDLECGMCYDFLGYDMKNVLTTGLWENIDDFIKQQESKLRRLRREKSGKRKGTGRGGRYIFDIIKDEFKAEEYHRYLDESIEETKALLKKFRAVTAAEDKYVSHILKVSSGNRYIDRTIIRFSKEERKNKRDHTLMVFDSTIIFPEFGQIWHCNSADRSYYTYAELFKNGNSVEWLTASQINEFLSPEECGEIRPFYALVPVFAGD
ncbi:MAG: hypothetical protein IJU51_01760 [Clostridia bacterium]|nr:hypothetical protein [Clostridia bacterium]